MVPGHADGGDALVNHCNCGERGPTCCFMPPHVLREIGRRGNGRQRKWALDALSLDSTQRAARAQADASAAAMVPLAAAPGQPQVSRMVYDAAHAEELPGSLKRGEGQPASNDATADDAYDGLGRVFEFYWSRYRRNSIDGAGMPLVATVHYSDDYNNALWNGAAMLFRDPDGHNFRDPAGCLEVIGHELTHGVTQHESGLAYQDQPGALNESMSDVFGAMIKQHALNQTAAEADWLIGAGMVMFPGQAVRSMRAPGTAYDNDTMGRDPQVADMAHYVQDADDGGGVHINSGIPNRAFFLLATALGGCSWEKAGQIWYDVQCGPQLKQMQKTVSFQNFAQLTAAAAGARYGMDGAEREATLRAWQAVGVL